MRKLEVDMIELESAFENSFWELSYYFDKVIRLAKSVVAAPPSSCGRRWWRGCRFPKMWSRD